MAIILVLLFSIWITDSHILEVLMIQIVIRYHSLFSKIESINSSISFQKSVPYFQIHFSKYPANVVIHSALSSEYKVLREQNHLGHLIYIGASSRPRRSFWHLDIFSRSTGCWVINFCFQIVFKWDIRTNIQTYGRMHAKFNI